MVASHNVVATSVMTTKNSSFVDYFQSDNQTTQSTIPLEYKPYNYIYNFFKLLD